MSTDAAGPLSRPVAVADILPDGLDVAVEASAEEREALARAFKLPAIHSLTSRFHLSGTRDRVHVTGQVDAAIEQICVVTLDPFANEVHEAVEVDFAAAGATPPQGERPAGRDRRRSHRPRRPHGGIPGARARSAPAQAGCRFPFRGVGRAAAFALCRPGQAAAR